MTLAQFYPFIFERLIDMKRHIVYFIFSLFFLCTITVLAQSGSASCAPKKPKINVRKLTLTKGNDYTLRVYNLKKKQSVRFTSDDKTIVSLAEKSGEQNTRAKSAVITATGIGSTTIRASVYSSKGKVVRTLKTRVHVTPYAVSIKFTEKKVKLEVSQTMKLSVIIKPNTSQELPVFSTSNADIVTVNSKGLLTAAAPGEAVITATLLSSGQKVQCRVQVIPSSEEDEEEFELNTLEPARNE